VQSTSASQNASASTPIGSQCANASATAQGSIGDNEEEEENDVKIGKKTHFMGLGSLHKVRVRGSTI
jgi:hypothetical protein